MERAYLAADLPALGRGIRDVAELSRVYFGHETCPWRLPAVDEVEEARRMAACAGLGFTLVTPPIPQRHLDGFLQRLASFRPAASDEIVFNDLGLLHAAATRGIPGTRVMGRLLLPLPNDPRMAAAADEAGMEAPGGMAADPSVPRSLLALGVARRDLDSPWVAASAPADSPVPFSLHQPWAILTVTRLCPWARTASGWTNLAGCAAPCRGHHLPLTGEEEPARLVVVAGNAWYAPVPEDLPVPAGVSRLVLQDAVLLG